MKTSSFISAFVVAALLVAFSAGTLQAQPAAPLADKHKGAGVQCAECHGKDTNEIVPNQNCFKCHESYAKLGERTKDMHFNPHKSRHFMDLDCTSCHVGHKADANLCQDCHGPISRKK